MYNARMPEAKAIYHRHSRWILQGRDFLAPALFFIKSKPLKKSGALDKTFLFIMSKDYKKDFFVFLSRYMNSRVLIGQRRSYLVLLTFSVSMLNFFVFSVYIKTERTIAESLYS